MPEIRLVPLLRALMVMLFAFPLANLEGSNGIDISDQEIREPCNETIAGRALVAPPHLPDNQDDLLADCEVSVAATAADASSL